MLAVATAYDALRAHLGRKPATPSGTSSARWRPYHSRKVSSGLTPDDNQSSLPTPEDILNPQRPARKATRQQPAPVAVQDPEGLIGKRLLNFSSIKAPNTDDTPLRQPEHSLSLLSSIYDPPMIARASQQSVHDAPTALPTPPASPTPPAHAAQCIAPQVMQWFIVELLRRSHTSAAVIRAAIAYITAAAPAIRAAIENDADPECPLLDPRRVYLAAIILGSKFLLDRTYTNKTWAAVSGLDALEVGRCERALGEALHWRLWVGGPSSSSAN
ncbi:cyclin [Ceratobasidium sp. AG-Ba]|nr:cyclin [Ceratobasidium sp. AG-Ba]